MATILFRNAFVLINGAELTAALHELNVEYGAEMLDATVFGLNTRTHKGGLLMGGISGKGFMESATDIERVLFQGLGGGASLTGAQNPAYQSGVIIEDSIITVYPDGITEGSLTTGMGFYMKGVLKTFNLGGAVGTLLTIDFAADTRGIETAS